jgi:dUTP pyrophosphatase
MASVYKAFNARIKLLDGNAKIPTKGSEYAAGYDLYADLDADTDSITIHPHNTVKINTGISIALPCFTFGAIFARSGLATKQGLRPANCVGVIDADYRGPVIVALHNDTNDDQVIHNGDRIAQLVVMPFEEVFFQQVDELDETERGSAGFGSTGSN